MPQLDWNATINAIREQMPQTQFQNWVKPLTLIRQDETSVVLGVPSRFHEEWLKSHYALQISQAIRNQCGSELQLEFEILIADENVEAALSEPAPVPTGRPTLRVVEGAAAKPASPAAMEIPGAAHSGNGQSEPAQPEAPNFPPFATPYFQFEFNHVAYQCAQMFVDRNASLNPLVIHAGVGMGKTHLLSEIGTRLHQRNPKLRIRYTNAESFTAEMVQGIRTNQSLTFKNKYRQDTDVLLFDDVQGIAGRERTQEELLHIFNEITARGGLIAFTTSVATHRLEEFIDPLKSRLVASVCAEVKVPTFEDRIQVLQKSSELNKLVLPPELLHQIAGQGQKDIRELAGSLVRLHLQAQLENRTLDTKFLAREGWVREGKKEAIHLDEIVALVEHNYGVPRTELVSKSRKSVTTWARQVAMYLARHYTLLPLEEIGKAFERDHATVIHAFQKVTEAMETQPHRKYEVEFLKQKLQARTSPDELPAF